MRTLLRLLLRRRPKPSSFRMTVTRRFRRSWTHWRLRSTYRQEKKAKRRLLLLQLEVDSQLLLTKELQERRQQLERRQRETLESMAWHQYKELPPSPPEPDQPSDLDNLLGM